MHFFNILDGVSSCEANVKYDRSFSSRFLSFHIFHTIARIMFIHHSLYTTWYLLVIKYWFKKSIKILFNVSRIETLNVGKKSYDKFNA